MTNGLMCYLIGSGLFLSSIGVGVYKASNSPRAVYHKQRHERHNKWLSEVLRDPNRKYGEYQALVELDETKEEFAIYEKICSLIIDNNPKLNEIEKTAYLRSIQRIISTMPYDCKIPRFSLNDEDFTLGSERKRIKKEIKKFMVSHGMKFRHDATSGVQYYELDKLTIDKVNEFIEFYEGLNGPDDRMPSYVGSA